MTSTIAPFLSLTLRRFKNDSSDERGDLYVSLCEKPRPTTVAAAFNFLLDPPLK